MLNALVPVFAVIILGHILRRMDFPGDGFWPQAERITYYLLFPALLVHKLSRASFGGDATLPMAAALVVALCLTATGLLILRRRMGLPGPSFSSVFQGGVRMNTYVGLAVVAMLYGDEGLTLAAVAMVAMIPVINLWCVPVVAGLSENGGGGWNKLATELAKNPLILGCVIGFGMNLSGLRMHESLYEALAVVGRAALPMGLLAVGAGLKPRSLGPGLLPSLWSAAAKLVALPLVTWLLCLLFGASDTALAVAVIFTALPTATSSYILARQLGGDADLMAAIITAQTVMSVITLPLTIALLA